MSEPLPELALRAATEAICEQLCRVAAGDLDVRLDVGTDDISAQKLAMLGNAVLHVARRAVAAAEIKGRELARAHEMARLGTWRVEVTAGVQSWSWSAELYQVFGTDPTRFVPNSQTCRNLIHPGDRARVQAASERALAGSTETYEWRAQCPDGVERRIWTQLKPEWHGQEVRALHAVCQDMTDRRNAEARIRHLTEHDGLTGLANRAVLRERLGKALTHRRRRRGQPAQVAVLSLDLDGLRSINERHGHVVGDRVLIQAAQRLAPLVRGGDTLARLGGDDFVVVQVSPGQPEAAERLASRLAAALAPPFDLGEGGAQATITASIGIAVSPGDAEEMDGLLAAADMATSRAKTMGGDAIALYHPEMEREARERRALEADLSLAIARGEMSVAYQPIVDVGNAGTRGFEALLRWSHPERGPVRPDLFIPIAEANGAILPIGEWALEQACAEAARWSRPLFVAVNVSPVQVQRGASFATMVEGVLARTGLAPDRLELEVTEGVLLHESEAALDALGRVRALGVRVALDDFGTGYSSLATLQAFPFDKIKIDRRFVAGLGGGSEQDATIVRAVLGLARGLGVPVVAEGVETEAQHDALRAERCAAAQGWLFGKPGPVPAELLAPVAAAGV